MRKQLVEGNGEEGQDDMEATILNVSPDLKGKGKAAFPGDGQSLNGVISSAKGKEKAKPVINLRKQRPQGRKLGAAKKGMRYVSSAYYD